MGQLLQAEIDKRGKPAAQQDATMEAPDDSEDAKAVREEIDTLTKKIQQLENLKDDELQPIIAKKKKQKEELLAKQREKKPWQARITAATKGRDEAVSSREATDKEIEQLKQVLTSKEEERKKKAAKVEEAQARLDELLQQQKEELPQGTGSATSPAPSRSRSRSPVQLMEELAQRLHATGPGMAQSFVAWSNTVQVPEAGASSLQAQGAGSQQRRGRSMQPAS